VTHTATEDKALWLPPGYVQKRGDHARSLLREFMEENLDEAEGLLKSIRGGHAPAQVPHKLVELFAKLGYYSGITSPQKATKVTLQLLRRIGESLLVRTIYSTRQRQVIRWMYPSVDDNQPGYKLALRDPNARPTAQDRKRMLEIGAVLHHGGYRRKREHDGVWGVWTSDYMMRAQGIGQTVSALVRDMLTLDGGALWTVPGRVKDSCPVSAFFALDGALIRRTIPDIPAFRNPQVVDRSESFIGPAPMLEPYRPQLYDTDRLIEYVYVQPEQQLDTDEQVLAEFTCDELHYVVRNPRTDWWAHGYGHSELESCLEIITGVVNAIAYNTSIFTHSNIPPGVLTFSGGFGEHWINDFFTTIVSNIGGPNKWHKLPILFGDPGETASGQYIPLRDNKQDEMMWREFLIFSINLLCGAYHIAAEEINFQAFLTRGASLGDQGGAERVAYAQETGLHDLVRVVFDTLDTAIVSRFYADPQTGIGPYTIVPTGVRQNDEEQQHQRRMDRLNTGLTTPNEERAETDRLPLRDPDNPELWDRIRERVLALHPDLEQDQQRLDDVVVQVYRKQGGSLRRWTDLPIAPNAQQARMMEMQEEQQGAGGGMEGTPPGMPAGEMGGEMGAGTPPPGAEADGAGNGGAAAPPPPGMMQLPLPGMGDEAAQKSLAAAGKDIEVRFVRD